MARFTVANKTENIEYREDDKKRWRTGGSGSLHRHLEKVRNASLRLYT